MSWLIGIFALLASLVSAVFRVFYMPSEPVKPEETDNVPPEHITSPVEANTAPEVPSTATLTNMCLAIKTMEGANPANNNPGNCRYYDGGYMAIYGHVTQTAKGFAVFPSYAQGWLYLQNLVKSMIHTHPNRTLLEFFQVYAPSSDGNDPIHYSQFVAERMGVNNSFVIGHILVS